MDQLCKFSIGSCGGQCAGPPCLLVFSMLHPTFEAPLKEGGQRVCVSPTRLHTVSRLRTQNLCTQCTISNCFKPEFYNFQSIFSSLEFFVNFFKFCSAFDSPYPRRIASMCALSQQSFEASPRMRAHSEERRMGPWLHLIDLDSHQTLCSSPWSCLPIMCPDSARRRLYARDCSPER